MKRLYLKKIDLQGFKSFADKISLEFETGITAVVGPNGSGKSNIADAVRWVLGEQSVKTLRGNKMEDVIFSGTEHRKSVSFAEVSLILDNSDKRLPIDYSEVNISRRIFRSGESEYYINKSACRLKDIYELFMDTGVGRDGYSIIGQGRIDEILSSKSDDRRNVFEEASGIMKYKTRKLEAERKLEATKQNLIRINDIINELEYQIDPLKEQSDKAKRYLELAQDLKILDINLFVDNYKKLNEKSETFKEQYNNTQKEYDECVASLDTIDTSQNDLSDNNKTLENEVLEINQEIFEIEKTIEKINSDTNLINQGIDNQEQNKQRLQNEITEYDNSIAEIELELNTRKSKLIEIKNSSFEIEKNIGQKEQELAHANALIEQSIEKIEDLKSEIIEKYNNVSNKRGNIGNINVLLENINVRLSQITDEIKNISSDKNQKEAQHNEMKKAINEVKHSILELGNVLNNASKEKADILSDLQKNSDSMQKMKENLNTKTTRFNLLSDMDKEYEGFNKSVKEILQECGRSNSLNKGVHGALVQLINVKKQYETAIDVALGGALQNIVTDDEETAQKLIEFLKANKLGRATFLPITSVKGREFEDRDDLLKQKGVVGIASQLVQFDKKYSGIIGNLLGKVLVVDNITNAVAIAKKYKYTFKIVTQDGEVLNVGGSIAGGSVNKSTSLLSRTREIEELQNEIKDIRGKLEVLTKENEHLIQKETKISSNIEDLEKDKKEKEYRLINLEAELKQFSDYFEMLEDRLKTLRIEENQLNEQKNNANSEIEKNNHEIESLLKEIEEMTQKTTIDQDLYKKELESKEKLQEGITAEKIKISGIEQEILAANENIERIQKEIESIQIKISDNKESITAVDASIASQKETIANLKQELAKEENSIIATKEKLQSKIQEKNSIEEKITELQKQWKENNSKVNLIIEEKNRIEVKIAKFEMELENLQNRIWDEYQITYNQSLQYVQDISRFGSPSKAISQLKAEINSLGSINVGAIEEYIKVKERYEFMSSQKNDLEEGEKSLRKVIADMVQIMKKQFVEQFEKINANFNEVFRELFGGGRAFLKLTDDDNVLESGIEIEAQPPGKKLQNLTLLSGGERALTAIAILFAMLKVRPTPFCVLDEIEAALDDVNVYRFAEFIKKFSGDTQFLIITHRKGTMEIAESIYGVTMQEHGISKLVSVKLN